MASASGTSAPQVTWTAAAGRWAVVVMNADGSSPVAAELTRRRDAPALRGMWTGLYTGAGVARLGGALLIALALPRRSPDHAPTTS